MGSNFISKSFRANYADKAKVFVHKNFSLKLIWVQIFLSPIKLKVIANQLVIEFCMRNDNN